MLSTSHILDIAAELAALPAAVVVIVFGGLGAWLFLSGRVVTGREHKEALDDKHMWRSLALRAMNITEAATRRIEEGG